MVFGVDGGVIEGCGREWSFYDDLNDLHLHFMVLF